ncbi:MAG TPA: nucleoside deaminase [Clostridiales bacterium]|nr:nucleoside deaminase [Clostridiales bacterium]
MRLAIREARIAAENGEVPVGAVIVKDGKVISSGRNRRETENNALYHAEIEAIDKACKALKSWRLTGCDLYVTLEPCPMCAGAIINARISRVIIGALDPKAGCCGSVIDMFIMPFNHEPKTIKGICADECASLLTGFFENLRNKK